MNKIFGLFGAGGFGREIIIYAENSFEHDQIKFIDDDKEIDNVNGIEVLNKEQFFKVRVERKIF